MELPAAGRALRLETHRERCRRLGSNLDPARERARPPDFVLPRRDRHQTIRRVDGDGVRLPRRDRLLARVPEGGGEPGDLGAGAQGLGATPDRGRDEAHRDREDNQGDDQLEEGEAPSIYFWLLSHDVMSAFSPSPPGAPSAPSDQRSYSPFWPGQQRYLY